MAMPRPLGAVTLTAGTPTPILSPILATVAAVSFSITNNIATIALGANNLPATGYNGPRGFGNAGPDISQPLGQGQQVILWGFTTATYFNGKVVTVLDNNGAAGTFRFAFTHANVGSTNDAGNTAPVPFETYRRVLVETGQGNGASDLVYVGDGTVSSSKYIKALTGKGQDFDFPPNDLNNIPAVRFFADCSSTGDTIQVSITY